MMTEKDFVYEILIHYTSTDKSTLKFHLEEAANNGNDCAQTGLNRLLAEKAKFEAKFNKLPNFSGNQIKRYIPNYLSNKSKLFSTLSNDKNSNFLKSKSNFS